jgi:hypothetical protein
MPAIRQFTVLRIVNGIARVRKMCGFCDRQHVARFPADDLLVRRRHGSFCRKCRGELEQALRDHPWLRARRRRQ